MKRKGLIALVGAGAVAALVSAGGILAVFQDDATTGADQGLNRDYAETPSRGREIDIVIARYSGQACGTYTHDLATGIFTSQISADPLNIYGHVAAPDSGLCIKNVGEQVIEQTDLSLQVFAVAQFEAGCTGDEAVVDPEGAGCGTVGEAAQSLLWTVQRHECGLTNPIPFLENINRSFPDSGEGPRSYLALAEPLEPGDELCFSFMGRYDPETSEAAVAGQSDIVRWRFRFTAESAE